MSGKYMTAFNAKELFSKWLSHGLIARDDQAELEAFSINQQLEHELPLYLRVLVGVGAFIASLCFIGFLSAAHIISFSSESGLIFWGVLFMGGAVLLAKGASDKDHTVKHSFLMQMSFCFMGTGKTLFVIGIAQLFKPNEQWGVTVATLLVTLATYHIYKMSIDRFLSSFAVLASIFFNLVYERSGFGASEILLNTFFIAQLGIAAILMTSGKIKREYLPLAYAFISSLCLAVTHFSIQSKIGFWSQHHDFNPAVINISLTVAIIALIGWAAGGLERLKSESLSMASLGAVLLGVISAPGILLSIGLMTLGYAKHERLLLLLGGLLFPVFLFFYYYNLDITLMTKSGILVASGGLILAGRAYMHHRGFDREA